MHGRIIQRRHGTLFQRHAGAILRIGRHSEDHRPGVFLVFAHEQVLNLGSASEREQKQAGRNRIQRAAMPDLLHLQAPPHNRDDIMRCHPGGFVDEQDAVRSCSQ